MNPVIQVVIKQSLKQLVITRQVFLRNFCAFLGKKRRNSGAILRLFDDKRQKITKKGAIMEIVNRLYESVRNLSIYDFSYEIVLSLLDYNLINGVHL
jgi:uncharacterized protein involved in tellurium resistance